MHTLPNLHLTSPGAAHVNSADNLVVQTGKERASTQPEGDPHNHSFTDTVGGASKRLLPVHKVITLRTLINVHYSGRQIQIYPVWMSLINSCKARKLLSELIMYTRKIFVTARSKMHILLTMDELIS